MKLSPLKLVFLGYIISAIAILAISLIISNHVEDLNKFWSRVIWVELLNLFFWFGLVSWADVIKSSQTSINPISSIIATLLCIISFVLMIIEYNLSDIKILNDFHFIIQIILFTGAFLLIISFNFLNLYGKDGTAPVGQYLDSPVNLSNGLIELEKKILRINSISRNDLLIKKIKNLSNKIKYSLQDNVKTIKSQEYQKLCQDINELLDSVEYLRNGENLLDKFDTDFINTKIDNFMDDVEKIILSLKKR